MNTPLTSLGNRVSYFRKGNVIAVFATGGGENKITITWNHIATLPSGCHPVAEISSAGDGGDVAALIRVQSTGVVQVKRLSGETVWWGVCAVFPVT